MIPAQQVAKLHNALPFWMSLGLVPLALIGAWQGGLALLLLPLYAIGLTTLLDALTGLNEDNPDTETPEAGLSGIGSSRLSGFRSRSRRSFT